jgi:hypothetical protein
VALAPQLPVAAPQHQFATTATRLRRPAPATQCTGTTTPEFFEKPKNSFDRRRDDNYAKMESASKRKAGGTALSPGEGRPAKRQKAPVRARPNDAQWCWLHRRQCVERCELCSARCGMCTWTWARCSRLGRPTGSTSHHRPAALHEHQTAPRCSRAWRTLQPCAMENTVLTMSFVHTGRHRRNGWIDQGDGLEVPRQLEAGQRQDVRARGSMCSEGKWD